MKPIHNSQFTNVKIGATYYWVGDPQRKILIPKILTPCDEQDCDQVRHSCSGFLFTATDGSIWHDILGDFIEMEDENG